MLEQSSFSRGVIPAGGNRKQRRGGEGGTLVLGPGILKDHFSNWELPDRKSDHTFSLRSAFGKIFLGREMQRFVAPLSVPGFGEVQKFCSNFIH